MLQKREKEKNLPAGLVIRYDIVRTTVRNPGRSVQLPSMRQLAERFGFSQRTVATEMGKLVREGWISGRNGVGYFTNPAQAVWPRLPHYRIAGILACSRRVSSDYALWAFQSYAGLRMVPDIAYPRNIELVTDELDTMRKEIENYELDGLIWIAPPDEYEAILKILHESGLPMVTVLKKIAGIPCSGVNFATAGKALAETLKKHGCTELFWCDFCDDYLKTMRISLAAAEPEITLTSIEHCENYLAELEKRLEAGKVPSAVLAYTAWCWEIIALFRKYSLDPYRDTILIGNWEFLRNDHDFQGILMKYPHEAIGGAAAELLDSEFKKMPPEDRIFELQIIEQTR